MIPALLGKPTTPFTNKTKKVSRWVNSLSFMRAALDAAFDCQLTPSRGPYLASVVNAASCVCRPSIGIGGAFVFNSARCKFCNLTES